MTTESTTNTNLWQALLRAQQSAKSVTKDGTNKHLGAKYASAEAIVEVAKQALNDQGLVPVPISRRSQGSAVGTTELEVKFKLVHAPTGEFEVFETTMAVVAKTGMPADKAEAATDTYNLGYWLKNLVMMVRDDPETAVDARVDTEPVVVAVNPVVTSMLARIAAAKTMPELNVVRDEAKKASLVPAIKPAFEAKYAEIKKSETPTPVAS